MIVIIANRGTCQYKTPIVNCFLEFIEQRRDSGILEKSSSFKPAIGNLLWMV